MATTDVHTLAGPYVLDALEGDELRAFEQHLAGCSWCRTDVGELRETAARLTVQIALAPPAALKNKVIAATSQLRQLPPLIPIAAPPEVAAKKVVRLGVGQRSMLALAAAALAVAGTGGVAVDQYRQNAGSRAVSQQITAVLSEPDARTVRGAVAGGGQATVVISSRRNAGVVLLHDLRPLPSGRVYQMWLIDSTHKANSIGLVPNGSASDQTKLIADLAGTAAFSLTVEPDGGSPEPTLPAAATVTTV
jgi:anti-sigma-K factor RskA